MRYLLILLLPVLISCKKDSDVCDRIDCTPVPTDTVHPLVPRLIWTHPVVPDTQMVFINEVVANSEVIFYSILKDGFEGTVRAVEVATGKTLWEWGDPFVSSGYSIIRLHLHGNRLIVESHASLFIIDTVTGQTVWKNIASGVETCPSPRSSVINNQIYYTMSHCASNPEYELLFRTPVSGFYPDTIIRLNQIPIPNRPDGYGWTRGIEPPQLWMNPQGDSVLIFAERGYILGTNMNKANLHAFNLRTRSLDWTMDSVVVEGNTSVHPFLIEGNNLYLLGEQSVNLIDLRSGTVNWRYAFTGGSEFTFSVSPTSAGNTILVQPGSGRLYSINKGNGSLAWKLNIGNVGPTGSLVVHDDLATYISAPNFYDINYITGKVVNEYSSPNLYQGYPVVFQQFAYTIRVPGTDYIFTSDERFAMLMKLNP